MYALENFRVNKGSQTQKGIYYVIQYIGNTWYRQIHRGRKQINDGQRPEERENRELGGRWFT